MRIGYAPDRRKGFAEKRISFLHVIAIVGLVAGCWYVWSRSQTARSDLVADGFPLPSLATADEKKIPAAPRQLENPGPTNRELPVALTSTNRFRNPAAEETNIVAAPLVISTNSNGSVALPDWIAEPPPEESYPSHAARSVLEAQIGMANRGISPGPIDGIMGSQTRLAIRAFQEQLGIPVTGALDSYTRRALWVRQNPLTTYVVQTNDLERLMSIPPTWLEKSNMERLDYETVVEIVAEKGWAYESFIMGLNPEINWSSVDSGTSVSLPNVMLPQFNSKAAYAKIHLADRNLQAYDSTDRIMIHFPCSIAQRVDKRPVGELKVAVVVRNPNYTFNPEIFTESEEGRLLGRKLTVPPGPNNPVGVAWVGLDRPGYGIHGTPEPELVGRTESHGCFRLANWNAQILADISWVGMPVFVER